MRDWPGPLVATLHNYRPLCAGASLYRAGATCTSCLEGDRWAGLRHGCYRESKLATAPLAFANRRGPGADPLLSRADRLVVLSELSRGLYQRAGIPAQRLALVPNFVADSASAGQTGSGDRWVMVGRLTVEKGILELLQRWPASEPLDIVGDGELLEQARAVAPASVRFLGRLDRTEVRRRLPSCRGLVFSSRCFENAPLVQLEALAAGLPILAFDGSSVAETVRARRTGTVVSWDEPLLPVLEEAAARFPSMRAHCRTVFDQAFTERTWVRSTEQLYQEVLASRSQER